MVSVSTAVDYLGLTQSDEMTENEIAREIVDSAYKVDVMLGPGLLELTETRFQRRAAGTSTDCV